MDQCFRTWTNCPSIFYCLGAAHGGSSLNRDAQITFSPASVFLGNPMVFPGQWRNIICPVCPGSPPPPPPSWTCRNTSTGSCPGGIIDRCPNHHSWLLSRRRSSGSTLSSPWISVFLTLSYAQKTIFCSLYPWSLSSGYYPKLITRDKGRNVDQPVNCSALFTTTEWYSVPIMADAALIRLLFSWSHLLVNKTLRYLEFSVRGSNWSPIERNLIDPFLVENHGLRGAVPHPGCFTLSCRSQPNEANRSTSL